MARHQDDGTGRCELSELLVTDCAGCRGHADPVVDMLLNEAPHNRGPGWTAPTGDEATPAPGFGPVTAKYHGQCTALGPYSCRIRPGDQIVPTRADGWMHFPSCPQPSSGGGWKW